MDLSPYVAQLRKDLASAASAGDEETRRAATLLAGAVEPAVRLALMNALSDLAAEVTSNLDDHVVDVRISGRDVNVVVTPVGGPATESAEHPESAPPPPPPRPRPPPRVTSAGSPCDCSTRSSPRPSRPPRRRASR
ncbi:hypothetical protein G443_004710 [Actinoalloteichus cyanogriseus DSM 43889]|uniref:Uncharacterized protein n=1 Tax=Actinoalloteichus caeruleus DSM 43889 TaxID=1120930 RepID=A0ABT1JPJ1_ACTCY|nr:hypothetical protein [Actinoalloteichus caeruleus DSM 43889]